MNARKTGGALVAAGVAALAVMPVASGADGPANETAKRPVKKTVKVRDFYFSPSRFRVPKGSTITWKWPSYEGGYEHDVVLKRKPRGVKRWRSELKSANYSYKRKLRKRGKYVVICSLHPNMRNVIRVK